MTRPMAAKAVAVRWHSGRQMDEGCVRTQTPLLSPLSLSKIFPSLITLSSLLVIGVTCSPQFLLVRHLPKVDKGLTLTLLKKKYRALIDKIRKPGFN